MVEPHNHTMTITYCGLQSKRVPVLIFSAGLADVLEEVLRQKLHRAFGNIRVVSNRMKFDEAGRLQSFVGKVTDESASTHWMAEFVGGECATGIPSFAKSPENTSLPLGLNFLSYDCEPCSLPSPSYGPSFSTPRISFFDRKASRKQLCILIFKGPFIK